MDEDSKLALRLTQVYARLLGERQRLETPPKYVTRLIPDRLAYEAAAPERKRRFQQIEEALPHLEYVIGMLDPAFSASNVISVRPKKAHDTSLPNGISGTALDILRELKGPLAPAEIVQIMGARYGLDLSTVPERQRYYDAINGAFSGTYREYLVEHPSDLPDNPGWRRKWAWKHPMQTG